jgi:hypothetical protein
MLQDICSNSFFLFGKCSISQGGRKRALSYLPKITNLRWDGFGFDSCHGFDSAVVI